MRALTFVRRYPLMVLGLLAVAFIAWIGSDALIVLKSRDVEVINPRIVDGPRFVDDLSLQRPNRAGVWEKARPSPHDTAQALPRLKPGMTRAEVEGLVGVPEAGDIHPAEVDGGRVVYRTSYEVDLGPPQTVRPIRPMPKSAPKAAPQDRTLVTLEFDATKPGHPLLGILYPDPLF